jgi:hypothetical protein
MPRHSHATAAPAKGGLMAPGKTGQKEAIAERQARAMDLRKRGKSFRYIGRELGVNEATACRDVHAVVEALNEMALDDADTYRRMELERLDALLDAITPKVQRGDAFAIDTARKLSESRRKLLGLDAPTKVAPTNPKGDAPYVPRDLSKLSEEQLQALEQIHAALEASNG